MENRVMRCLVASLIGVLVLGATPARAAEGDRLYVVIAPEDTPGEGALIAFDVNDSGALVQAESYDLGGNGWLASARQGAVFDHQGQLLFVSNNESAEVSVFSMEDDGTPQTVDGSPFLVGKGPAQLAAHPSLAVLYIVQWLEGTVGAFEVSEGGVLSFLDEAAVEFPGDLAVEPAGRYLYVADLLSGVRGFAIAADGSLEELAGSPFSYDFSRPWSVEVSSTGDRVYVLDLDAGLAVFELRADGGLDLVPGSPFPVGGFTEFLVLAENDRTLYIPRSFGSEIVVLQMDPSGVPSELPGSPFPGPFLPAALLAPAGTEMLLVASVIPGDVESFGIEASGALSPLGGPNPVSDPEGRLPNGAAFRLAPPPAAEARIDIKPGSDTNPIQPKSRGLISVALFGSDSLDVQNVDWSTVRFGPGGAAPHRVPRDLEDGNGDGRLDAVVHFRTRETGIGCGDETATLTGGTVDGRSIEASDVVRPLGCR